MAGFLSDLFGSKPVVPNLPQLNLGTEQQKALAANLAAIPGAEAIGTQVDLFNQKQIDQMLGHVIPNYQQIFGNIGANIGALTAGQIPADVAGVVQSSAAAGAVAGGFAGSESERNLVARDLGLTSLQLTQQGLSSAESWMKTASSIYQPGMFNVSSMFVTPAQQAAFDTQERNAQFQRNWMQNQINAMPDPTTVGLWNATWSVVDAALSAYTGSSVNLGIINPQGSLGTGGTSAMNLGGGTAATTGTGGGTNFFSGTPMQQTAPSNQYLNFFGTGGGTGGTSGGGYNFGASVEELQGIASGY